MLGKDHEIRLGDNSRYHVILGGDKNFCFLPTENYTLAVDEVSGKTVLLHIFNCDDGMEVKNALMLEADTANTLEELPKDCASALLLEDSFISSSGGRIACLVYSLPEDCVPLGKLLEEREMSFCEMLKILESVVNTIAYAAKNGICHGSLDRWHILVGRAGKTWICGYGMKKDATLAYDESSVAELAQLALRECRKHGNSREERQARKRLSEIALGDIYFFKAPVSKRRFALLSGSGLCVLLMCAVFVMSAYIITDNIFHGENPAVTLKMPRLVGLIYRGYDEAENIYTFSDPKSGEVLTLDGDSYSVKSDTTDDYYIYHDGVSDFGSNGVIYSDAVSELGEVSDGTVISQNPSANDSVRAQPGYRQAEIRITLQKGKAKLAVKSASIIGCAMSEAGAKLEKISAKYKVNVIYNRKIPAGTVYSVLDKSFTETERIGYGDEVILLVSGGEKK